jgi:hypothetical protein
MTIDKKEVFTWLFIFGGGYLAYRLTLPKKRKSFKTGQIGMTEHKPEDREYIVPPTMDESQAGANPLSDNAFTALKAYITAYNAQEPQNKLDELNGEIANDYGLKVVRRRTDNRLAVYDLNDSEVLVYNG